MAGISLSVKDTGRLKLYEQVDLEVEVGIQEEEASQIHEASGLTVGALAEIHEFGAGASPPRAPVRSWFDLNLSKMKAAFRDELKRQGQAQQYSPGRLIKLAEHQSASMRARVLRGEIMPRNKASTLAKKKPETRPLIEGGDLVKHFKAKFLFFGRTRDGSDFEVQWREGEGEGPE